MMGQFAVNQLVMFIVTIILFLMVIFLAIHIAKIKRDFAIKQDEYIKQILTLGEKKNGDDRKLKKNPGKGGEVTEQRSSLQRK